MKTLFDLCTPRADVLAGALRDQDLAADLAQVLNGTASPEYLDAARFFAHTHPTAGPVGAAAADFDALENLRRLAFSDRVAKPVQLEIWENAEA